MSTADPIVGIEVPETETIMSTADPIVGIEVLDTETLCAPVDDEIEARTLEDAKWDLKLKKLQEKWAAASAERKRLHDLLPAQERFHFAVKYNLPDQVKSFLETGDVDINQHDAEGRESPLQSAAWRGHVEVVDLLLLHGADVHDVNHTGHTSLHLAVIASNRKRYEQVVASLLRHKSDVNKPGAFGQSPIHSACLYSSSAIVKILIEHGADLSRRDYDGRNAFHLLVVREPRSESVRKKILRMLLNSMKDDVKTLCILNDCDNSDYVSDDEFDDDGGYVPGFTPHEFAELFHKHELSQIMKDAEKRSAEQLKHVRLAARAKAEVVRRQRRLAVAMSLNPRLGEHSSLGCLGPDLLQMVAKRM
jgi:ankyrin repeat protein